MNTVNEAKTIDAIITACRRVNDELPTLSADDLNTIQNVTERISDFCLEELDARNLEVVYCLNAAGGRDAVIVQKD